MTKSKLTKKALLCSILTILLSTTMLIGTTFAWFTDTASTSVNKIQAGNLNVDIVDEDGNSLNEKTLNFRNVNGETNILWEPGASFELDSFKIVNKGNLAFKYKVTIGGINGAEKLNEVIDFTIKKGNANPEELEGWDGVLLPSGETSDSLDAGETELFTISAKMKEDAGNEYQGLSLDSIGISVIATQYTYEYDSEDNQYDKDAEYSMVTSVDELIKALKNASDGDTIYLAAGDFGTSEITYYCDPYSLKNIKIVGVKGTSIGLRFGYGDSDKLIEGWIFENINFVGENFGLIFYCSTKDITVENCTFTGGQFSNVSGTAGTAVATNLTIENCVFKNTNYDDVNMRTALYIGENNNLTIKDCTFDNPGYNAIQLGEMQGDVTIENNKIDGTRDRALRFTKAAKVDNITLTIKNNVITNSKDADGEMMKANDVNYTITLDGNTWDGKTDSEVSEGMVGSNYIVK